MTSKVAILLYVAIFSVLGQNAFAQTCATSVTLTPVATSICTDASTGTATVSFVVTTNPVGGIASATVRLFRDGNPVEVAQVVAGGTATSVTITDPNATPGVHAYDVTVLKSGCPNVQSAPGAVQVTVYGTPNVTGVSAGTQTICSGQTANFNVTVQGPITGTISFTVHNVEQNTNFTVTAAASSSGTTVVNVVPSPAPVQTTTYVVTAVAGANNCNTGTVTNGTFTVTVQSPPPIGNLTTPQPICQGGTLAISATNVGAIAGNYTFTWYKNGVALIDGATGQGSTIAGANSTTLNITNAQPSDAGNYYLQVCSDAAQYSFCSGGCAQTNVVTAVVNALPTATFSPVGPTTVCTNSNTQVTVTLTGAAPFAFTYAINGVTQPVVNTSSTTFTINVNTGTAGTTQSFTIVNVSDQNCVNSVNVTSTATFNVSTFDFTPVTPATICYGATTNISLSSVTGGVNTVTYRLFNSSGTQVGESLVRVGNATGTFATAVPAGTYTITATNANGTGCVVSRSVVVNQYPQTMVSAVTTAPIRCNGGTTSVTVTVTGGSPGDLFNVGVAGQVQTGVTSGTYTFQGVPAGVYAAVATNTSAGNCAVSSSITVLQPAPIVVTATPGVTALTCNGQTTTIAASVTGGNTGVFTYVLSGGPTTGTRTSTTGVTFTNVLAGNYTITVTDVNGCVGSVTAINITQPNAITGTVAAVNATCNAGTGAVQFNTVAGGTAPYRYSISGGLTGATAATNSTTFTYQNVLPGTYTATVIDANNCTQVLGIVTVTAPSAVTASVTAGNIQCFGGTTTVSITNITGGNGGNIVFTLTGATGSPTTLTNTGSPSSSFFPVSAGTYTLTANNVGCPAQVVGTVTITEPAPIVVTTAATAITCVNGTSTVTISASAGTATLSYQLINANTSVQFGSTITNNTGSAVFSGVPAGTYNYIVTNVATGCVQQSTPGNPATQITINPVTQVVLGTPVITNVTCFGGSNGSIAIRATGGAANSYNYTAVGPNGYTRTIAGSTTVTFTGLFAGSYTITAVDANGCTAASSVVATVGGGTASGTGAPDLVLGSSANTLTFPTTGSSVSLTYTIINPSGNAATGVVLRVSKPTPDYTVELGAGATGWSLLGENTLYAEFTLSGQINCGTFTPLSVPVIVTRTAAATGKGAFPISGYVYSSVQDANDADNTRVDRFNAQ